jgi:hypothetical protein
MPGDEAEVVVLDPPLPTHEAEVADAAVRDGQPYVSGSSATAARKRSRTRR